MRTSMNRAASLSLLVAALMTLGGCDQNKSPAGNPTAVQAAPDPNGPPTDDEIFAIYRAYWTQNVKGASYWSPLPFQDYVQPYAANKYDNGVTQTNAFGKEYSVTVKLTYRALRDVMFRCAQGIVFDVIIYPVGTNVSEPDTYTARAGQFFACNSNYSFTKIDEGWIFHVTPGTSYTIRR